MTKRSLIRHLGSVDQKIRGAALVTFIVALPFVGTFYRAFAVAMAVSFSYFFVLLYKSKPKVRSDDSSGEAS
jgi:hypothetical protein